MNLEGKNIVLAYAIWFFLGGFGIHRFYFGRTGSGIGMLVLFLFGWITTPIIMGYFFLLGFFIWWVADAIQIPKWVEEANAAKGIKNSSLFFQTERSKMEDYEMLEKLHGLYEKGVMTKEQFESRRDSILAEDPDDAVRP